MVKSDWPGAVVLLKINHLSSFFDFCKLLLHPISVLEASHSGDLDQRRQKDH